MKNTEFARYWAGELGAISEDLKPLKGGINNSVFLCRSKQCSWVIKGYPCLKPGQRDRMQADVDLMRYAAKVAPGFTPILLEVDHVRRCIVMEYIRGETYPEGLAPCKRDLDMAFEFFFRLNSNFQLGSQMVKMEAAEGFLSLRQHMGNILDRLSAMGIEHLPKRYQAEGSEILNKLYALAEDVSQQVEVKIGSGMVEDTINADERCISPSDFGFHNAIRMNKGVKFIDFEFAGWDDPAKLCIDFVLQQRNPVHLRSIDVASRLFPNKESLLSSRIDAMTNILRLKWLCIVMGILNPAKLTQVLSAEPEATEASVVDTQLKRYYSYCKMTNQLMQSKQHSRLLLTE